MRRQFPRVEPDGAKAAKAKYGLIVAALSAATLTVARRSSRNSAKPCSSSRPT
jgi:hypothetical protein